MVKVQLNLDSRRNGDETPGLRGAKEPSRAVVPGTDTQSSRDTHVSQQGRGFQRNHHGRRHNRLLDTNTATILLKSPAGNGNDTEWMTVWARPDDWSHLR